MKFLTMEGVVGDEVDLALQEYQRCREEMRAWALSWRKYRKVEAEKETAALALRCAVTMRRMAEGLERMFFP